MIMINKFNMISTSFFFQKHQVRLDLTKPKVESDQQAVNRMLRDFRLRPPVLKVTDRKHYPTKTGFWSSLMRIEATGIEMQKIDYRMNPLKYLTFLNLSSNSISSIELVSFRVTIRFYAEIVHSIIV